MNERHASPSAGGQKRSGLWTDTKPPQTSPLHTSANQETRSEKPSEKWNRRVKVGGKKITLNRSSTDSDSMRLVEFGDLTTGGKDHIQKHMYTQSEIPESLWARTITHCPPPPAPPLREGHHSGPNGLANSDPEPPLAPLSHLLRIHLPSCFFLLLFSTAFFLSLSFAFCLFFL